MFSLPPSHLIAAVTFGANAAHAVRVVYERCVGVNLTCISQLGESSLLLPFLENPISLQRPLCAQEPKHTSHLQEAQRPSTLVLPRAKKFCWGGIKGGEGQFLGRTSFRRRSLSPLPGSDVSGCQILLESSFQAHRRRKEASVCGQEHLPKDRKKGSCALSPFPPHYPFNFSKLLRGLWLIHLTLLAWLVLQPTTLGFWSLLAKYWDLKTGRGLSISRGAIWGLRDFLPLSSFPLGSHLYSQIAKGA